MLNYLPMNMRDADDSERTKTSKKVYSRRPWYAPPVDPAEVLNEQEYAEREPDENVGPDYDDRGQPFEPSATLQQFETLRQMYESKNYYETTMSTVTEYSLSKTIDYKEAVLVALGGASAALVLLIVIAGIFVAHRRKINTSPAPSPPILVYPPHDVPDTCYTTKEVNFSLPALRSTSMGELRDAMSVCSFGSEVLSTCPSQCRSNSFTNTTDIGVLDPSIYKNECLSEDFLWPDGHVGRVWFTLKYESATERLQVHIVKAKHLPSRTPALANACDPYIKIQLMPDERRVVQTKQKKKSCNPFYDESFVYQIPSGKLEGLTLKLSVIDGGRLEKEKQLIGHIILPLSELDGAAPDEEPQLYKMDLEKEIQDPSSEFGEILVSLLYNENLSRLTVTVVQVRNLKLEPSSLRHEMVVRVTQERACRGVRARRTTPVEISDDGSALVSECFHFRLKPDELHTTCVTIQALEPHSVYGKDRLFGKFVLGSYMFARGRALQHWNKAIGTPMEQAKSWHPLSR